MELRSEASSNGAQLPSSMHLSYAPQDLDQSKRKRGRPRKYQADTMAPPLAVTNSVSDGDGGPQKKPRGRPPGSLNKNKASPLPLSASAGTGFTPHVITVKAGEDIYSKIMAFSQNCPRTVCILSANGAISNVTLHQAATSGGTVTYEGRYEILSLSGSFTITDSGGQRSRTGGLSVSLAGSDGRVLGGGVAGLLTAAGPVQVTAGSFLANENRELKQISYTDAPTAAPAKLAPVRMTGISSPSGQGIFISGGSGSPHNQSIAGYNNNHQQSLPNMTWKQG